MPTQKAGRHSSTDKLTASGQLIVAGCFAPLGMETTQMEWHHGDYVVTDDRDKIDVDVVHWLLSASYWATNRPKEVVQKTIDNSICFSVLLDGKQVGFARAVTDRAVFAWIADLIIDPEHRGKGLGKFIMACIQDHPEIPKSLQVLRTRDAHSLYERFGFEVGEFLMK